MSFYCNHHSSLFFYLEFVGSLETFLKNLSSVWDIFHVGFLASCSVPSGCNNNSIAVVELELPHPNLFAIDLGTRRVCARSCELKLLLR